MDKVLGEYAEGGSPPDRLREQAVAFANLNPTATRAEFTFFAAAIAEAAWRAAYLRGVEHSEREPVEADPNMPEKIADHLDPDWRWRPMDELEAPDEVVPDRRTAEEEIARANARAGYLPRGIRSR